MNLRLLQIADSALPISSYTHSWGLEAAIARGLVHDPESLEREVVAVEHCRDIGKKDMKRNEAAPQIKVDADTYQVWVDGKKVSSEPLKELPMTQRYFLF